MTTETISENGTAAGLALESIRVDPQQLLGGEAAEATGTVTLSTAAPAGGASVELFTDQPESVAVPSAVRVTEGARSATFEVAVQPVDRHLATQLTATLGGISKFAMLAIRGAESDAPARPLPAAPPVTPNGGVAASELPNTSRISADALAGEAAQDGGGQRTQESPRTQPTTDTAPPLPSRISEVVTWPKDPKWPSCAQSFRASLVIALPAVPFIALVSMLAVYAAASGSWLSQFDPVPLGTGLAVALWLLIAVVYWGVMRATSADQVNIGAFNELRHRLGEITTRASVVTASDDSSRIALGQVKDCIGQITAELERSGPVWVLGTGYVSVWKLVHRAEEALLLLEPGTNLIAAALYDELRLTGAQIDNSDQLLSKLRLAVAHLSPDAAGYLNARPSGVGLDASGQSKPNPSADDSTPIARVALREVRQTINEFRDNSWDAIVRTRNHLMATLTATGIATYLGFALAISVNGQARGENIQMNAVIGAGAFYLVGAVVGLFNRLNTESNAQNDVEDYGLTMARLSLTPVLAGLAAVGGVFLAAMAASGVTGAVLGSGSSTPNDAVKALPYLGTIFNLSGNPFGLVLAAVFGLSPSMLISSLQDQAEKYKSALKSTAPQGR